MVGIAAPARGRKNSHKKRRKLGQHFLVSHRVAERIVRATAVNNGETVFELGTGRGILTGMLCQRAGRVISVEADCELAGQAAIALSGFGNLKLVCGDGLATGDSTVWTGADGADTRTADDACTVSASSCDVFVSNLPYSHSRQAVEQLAASSFGRCTIMVQKEFALKLLAGATAATKGNRGDRRAVSVIAQYCFEISTIMDVPAVYFEPRPKVDSVVITMIRRRTLDERQIMMINRIFSYRRKRLSSILRIICKTVYSLDNCDNPDCSRKSCEGTGDGRDGNPDAASAADMNAKIVRIAMAYGVAPETLRIDDLCVSDVISLADYLLEACRMAGCKP